MVTNKADVDLPTYLAWVQEEDLGNLCGSCTGLDQFVDPVAAASSR